jgi:superfamily II DNA or RNA helicase
MQERLKIEDVEIINIRKIKTTSKSRTMYDLEIEDNHNFFANGILSHNSGTAFRDDGNDMKMTSVVGDIIHSVTADDLIQQGYLVNPDITFIGPYMTDHDIMKKELLSKSGLINETFDYSLYYEHFIYKNEKRNDIVKKIIEDNPGKKILIVSKLVDHGAMLSEELDAPHLYGATPTKQRKQTMKDFVNGKFNVLISTISIFAEGIDIPTLDIVINVAANKGSVKTIQLLGRVLRKSSNKDKKAKYYDFIDESRFFRNASYERQKALRNEGHTIVVKDGLKDV